MTELLTVVKAGLHSGLKTLFYVLKICVPVYFGVRLIEGLGWLEVVGHWLHPLMSLFGLPGEAAVPLVLGLTINLYSLVGALAALDLSVRELTIVAGITLMAHALFMEGAVMAKSHANALLLTLIRLATGACAGLLLNWLLPVGV